MGEIVLINLVDIQGFREFDCSRLDSMTVLCGTCHGEFAGFFQQTVVAVTFDQAAHMAYHAIR